MSYTYTANPSDKNWADIIGLLHVMFGTWRVKEWSVACPMQPPQSEKPSRTPYVWARYAGQPHEAQVTVRFVHPKDGERNVTVSRFQYPQDNLWAIWKGLDSIRLNELRGIDDVERQFYGALPPAREERRERDPYEVLGVRLDASPEVIEASYKAMAHRHHPDKGGDTALMAEINAAWDRLKP